MFKRNVILLIILSVVLMVTANALVIMDIGTMQLTYAFILSSIILTAVTTIYYAFEKRQERLKATAKN